MSPVAILRQRDILIASLQQAPTDAQLTSLRDELSARVGRDRARYVVLDLSLVDLVDSFAARTISAVAATTELRGAQTVIVGLQPDVAQAMVELGLGFRKAMTALDLDDALDLIAIERGRRR